ncbi:nitrate reductase [Thalassotalea eurytherma]|uniref:Nitrate reductase n=1 Tax=Thalassotalea eurytherma TaxID=1144278 RepID=A0ABQ6H4T9_9GAMM|nr:molybdopterin-dependent oxidoreductase [Thalassotalea eurytherma]GLX81842.1 nitrate reductase [Thalassotalea eurytherma]
MSIELPNSHLVNPAAGTVATTCAYCGVGCGVDINISKQGDSRDVDTLNGCRSHPANYGRLCVKGSNLLNTLEPEQRLIHAYIGNEQVSVDKATSFVAEQFNKIRQEHGPESVAFYVSGQLLTEDYYVANKLMKGYIGSANIDTNSRLCMSSAVAAYKRAFGEDVVPCNYTDIEQCDVFFTIGSNMAWTHPVLFQRLERAREVNPNLKVVSIDPRKTATTQLADLHLPLTPGSDSGFFNGLLRYLIDNKKIDQNYIDQHCNNFASAMKACSSWTLDKVSAFCQLEKSDITQAYQLFADSPKVVSFYSMGINQSNTGVDKCNAIINCHLATGKINKPGAGPFSITGQPNAMGGREIGGLANQLTGHLDIDNVDHQQAVKSFWQSPTIATKAGPSAVEMFSKIQQGKIKAVWIMATNPAVSLPDHQNIIKALESCPLVIVSDCVEKNDTLAFADVKLPATGWLEKDGTVTNSERRISRQRGVRKSSGNAKHDWQLICDVANKMGFTGFDYHQPVDIFTEFAKLSSVSKTHGLKFDITGLSKLSEQEYNALQPMQWPINDQYPLGCSNVFHDHKFSTLSHKANFIAVDAQLPLLGFKETDNNFIVNSGRIRDQWHTMTRTGNTHKLFTTQDQPFVSINIEDAKAKQLKNNQLIKIANSYGSITLPVKIDEGVGQGQLFVPIHWNKQYASSANVTNLYPAIVDKISNQPQLKQTNATIETLDFSQYLHVYTSQDISLLSDYWHKLRGNGFYAFEAANLENQQHELAQLKLAITGEWLSFSSDERQVHLCLSQKQLVCYLDISNIQKPINTSWLEYMFTKAALSFADIQSLLIAQPSDEFMQGKVVCSCFSVREKNIVEAINKGCRDVTTLGSQLNCGTNCGSCRPELKQYIKRFLDKETLASPLPETIEIEELT